MDMQHYKTFNEDTSQGIVGLLRPSNKTAVTLFKLTNTSFPISAVDYFFVKDTTYPMYIFKIPKEVNTLVDHEFKVSTDLIELSQYLPHFNRILEVKRSIKCYIPNNKIKKYASYNPFIQYNCTRDILIAEYIPSKLTFLKYIQDYKFNGCFESIFHQLLLALFIAQQKKQFTHYDLHLENILLRRCFERTFFLYKFVYEGIVIRRLINTHGYFPVLFDYGFAFSQGLNGTSYNNSLFFTNKGYTPFMFDNITDFRTLLVRLTYLKHCPVKFISLVDTIFLKSNLNFKINKETGWINAKIPTISRTICKDIENILKSLNLHNTFVYKELDNIIDLFGILIKLPIEQQVFDTSNLTDIIQNFTLEWNKIDLWFSNIMTDDKLNIVKYILEAINILISEDISEDPINYKQFIQTFKLKLFEIFDSFGSFINVKTLDYRTLLTSMIELSNYIEYTIYNEIQRYKELFNFNMDSWTLLTTIEDIFVSSNKAYKFQTGDSIVIFDSIEKCTSSFELLDSNIVETLNISSKHTQIDILDNLQKINIDEE